MRKSRNVLVQVVAISNGPWTPSDSRHGDETTHNASLMVYQMTSIVSTLAAWLRQCMVMSPMSSEAHDSGVPCLATS
jgi:hypothetical protein